MSHLRNWIKETVMAQMMLRSLVVLTLSIFLVEYVAYRKSSQQIRHLTEERQHSLTVLFAGRIDHILRRVEGDLNTLYNLPSLRDFFLNRRYELFDEASQHLSNVADFLIELRNREPAYEVAWITDVNNRDLLVMSQGKIQDLDLFKLKVESIGEVLCYIESLDTWALQFKQPLQDQGEQLGWVTLFYRLDNLTQPLSEEHFFQSGHLAVYDSDHRILYDPNINAGTLLADENPELQSILTGDWNQRSHELKIEDQVYLVNASRLSGRDWYVAAIVPRDEMLAGLFGTRKLIILLVVINVLVEVVFLYLFTRNLLTSPIRKLLEGTRAIARNDYSFRVNLSSGNELGQLASSFNSMAASMEKTIRELNEGQSRNNQLNRKLEEKVVQLEAQIKERKKAEAELRRSEDRLTGILENTTSVIFMKNLDGRYLMVNRQYERLFQVSRYEVIGKTDHELFPTHMADVLIANDKKVLRAGKLIEFEEQTPQQDGIHTFISVKFLLHDQLGEAFAVCGISTDITERKMAEQETYRLRIYLQNIIDSMPSIMVGVDSAGTITLWNRQAMSVTAFSAEQAIDASLAVVMPQLAFLSGEINNSLLDGRSRKKSKVNLSFKEHQGLFDITIFPLSGTAAAGVVLRLDDVTQKIRMEEMVIQSEKMLSVGGLAAGMAHEINNPLAGIMQNAQVLENRLSETLPKNLKVAEACGVEMGVINRYMHERGIFQMLEAISESGRRAARIVDNMLSFSRKSESKFSPSCLKLLLDQTLELVSNDYDLKNRYDFRHFQIERDYDANPCVVPCEAGKIQQVFLNILKNGAQAMALARVKEPCFSLSVRSADGFVRVQIRDNGPGMSETTRKRIFEPFFTTKPVGIGTGLGLSVSYFIITENHSGTISVESKEGQGACFRIYLPEAREEV